MSIIVIFILSPHMLVFEPHQALYPAALKALVSAFVFHMLQTDEFAFCHLDWLKGQPECALWKAQSGIQAHSKFRLSDTETSIVAYSTHNCFVVTISLFFQGLIVGCP